MRTSSSFDVRTVPEPSVRRRIYLRIRTSSCGGARKHPNHQMAPTKAARKFVAEIAPEPVEETRPPPLTAAASSFSGRHCRRPPLPSEHAEEAFSGDGLVLVMPHSYQGDWTDWDQEKLRVDLFFVRAASSIRDKSMEGNSSDEELSVIKKRKPYTITKQREKWTQEEHTRFLEALKLYGRAWQRIEVPSVLTAAYQVERITKTLLLFVANILAQRRQYKLGVMHKSSSPRSVSFIHIHKWNPLITNVLVDRKKKKTRLRLNQVKLQLEKEAVEKGIAPGQVHDIDIPPPRPKRKSSSPYPRKSSIGTLALEEAMSRKPEKSMPLLGENQVIDIKSDSSGEKLMAIQKLSRKRISEDANCSEVVNAFKDAKSNSISSLNKISSSHSAFIEFLPTTKEIMAEKIATNKSSAPLENSKSFIEEETEGRLRKFSQQQSNLGLEDEGKTSKLEGLTILDSSKGDQANANKSTMHVSNCRQSMQIDASDSQNPFSLTDQVGDEANGSLASTIPVQDASTISYFHQPHTASVPLTHLHDDQDVYRSFFNSSTFPSLIVSTLLQNPAVHAAANLAASFCPSTVLPSTQYIPEAHNAHMNPTPSLEAIAAATVSAAAAWWATQGLLPCFPPLAGFAFSPPNINVPCTGISLPVHVTADDNFPKEMQQIEDQHKSEAIKPQHASSKSMSSSSSGSDDCDGRDEISKELKDTGSSKIKTLAAHRSSDLDKAMNQKKVDRSSCGSNTASSSEVETYTMEKKHEKVNDEGKKDYDNFSKCGFNNYRLRSSGSLNESLKVSSEGRLAFQALFDREVLPQSFSPPQTEKATTLRKKETSESKVNHKNTVCCSTNLNQQGDKSKEEMYIVHEKRKVHQSGFKPYRRCSVEAESNALAEGAGSKRIRLQGEASS
ncbi:hypothetical protein ZIOFF_070918 [Zingiber officinale]|uniref:HTH myb-type domain-containing protein n=2 Tax=Zingiber officinale TaxID=94328 RepID=A0A8J5EU89_ZINOF|nr:hypothetical protein ZIOFF_070918 [Zingiber officinale]